MSTKHKTQTQPEPEPVEAMREAQAMHDAAARLAMQAASTHLRASIALGNLIVRGRASVMGHANPQRGRTR